VLIGGEGASSAHALRSTKLWTSVRMGPADFLPTLLYVTAHLGVKRLVGVVEDSLMDNLPPQLTPALIRSSAPECSSCIVGNAQQVRSEKTCMGDALLRTEVPVERQHVEGRVLGYLVSIDFLDCSGGDADTTPEGYRYLLVAVDM